MARSQDHHCFGIAGEDALKSLEQHALFFVVDGAAADQHRAGALGAQALPQPGKNFRFVPVLQIEFQVPGDLHASLGRTNVDEALAVFPALGEKEVDVVEDAGQPPM